MADFRFLNPITILSDVGGVSIDVTDRLTETYENIVTENPTEDGSPTTDHIVTLPVKISIEGGFSDLQMTNYVGPAITQQAVKGRAKTQFDKLLALYTMRSVFYVMDGLHLIKDMTFKSLRMTKEKEGFALNFSAELWQIQRVQLLETGTQSIITVGDEIKRAKVIPQLLLSVGAITTEQSLKNIGILA